MLSKEELFQKENFKVNEKEYFQISGRNPKDYKDYCDWDIFYKWVLIHSKLNDLFEYDSFIAKLIADSGYSRLIKDKNEYGYVGKLNSFSFDHTISIKLRSHISHVPNSDTIRGTVTFPYFNRWSDVGKWIENVPESFSVYIINPRLIFYNIGAVGLFLTPTYHNGIYIEAFNRFIISLTGFPLFLTYSQEENVEEITFTDFGLCKKDFINEIYSQKNDKSLLNMLNFWNKYECVSIPMIERSFEEYMQIQSYWSKDSIDFLKLTSSKPCKLEHKYTGEILATFKEFSYNPFLKLISTEDEKIELSNQQLTDLLDGKYEFKLI